jgi:hypothetical protein
MEYSPSWEADRFAASEELPHTLRNPKVPYRIHKSPQPAFILSQINPVHASPIPHPPIFVTKYKYIVCLMVQSFDINL